MIIAVAVVQIPVFARLLRGQMLAQRESETPRLDALANGEQS